MGIQVTNVCNMTCDHCITDSSPHARGDLEWPRIEDAIRRAAPYVDGVCVTGGEPLLRRETTMRVIRLTRALGLRSSIVTNGYWARNGSEAVYVFSELGAAGLDKLAVSFDRFHDRLVSSSSLDTLLATGADTSIEIQVQYCGDRRDDAYRIAMEAATRHGVALTTAEVLPFGRGRRLARTTRIDIGSIPRDSCGVMVRPVLTPEGELFTCCGPARGSSQSSPLRLGLNTADVSGALRSASDDPILNAIHCQGPRALFDHLSQQTRERITDRVIDHSICALCRAITDDDEAVSELRDALEDNRLRLIALSAVMQVAQNQGSVIGPKT
ncbi:MAG: radical SAM protein [Pseudonocardiaceae bacterium]